MFNNTNQKILNEDLFLNESHYPLVDGLPSQSLPQKRDLDAAYKDFQKFVETEPQKYLQEREFQQASRIYEEEIASQKEATLQLINQVEADIDIDLEMGLSIDANRQKLASRCLEDTRSQATENLKEEGFYLLDTEHLEQQKVVDEMRFNLGRGPEGDQGVWNIHLIRLWKT